MSQYNQQDEIFSIKKAKYSETITCMDNTEAIKPAERNKGRDTQTGKRTEIPENAGAESNGLQNPSRTLSQPRIRVGGRYGTPVE